MLGVFWILVFMSQGQDLVRGIGEDYFWQYPSGLLQIAFALGLLFLAFQAWGWSRIVINSNYGADRRQWRPAWLLVWGPRVLGALPFAAAAIALFMNPASNTWFVIALVALGVIFFVLVIKRQDIQRRMATRRGADPFPRLQRFWVIASLALAGAAMIVATVWPARLGALLGAPAVVFLGLGLIIPIIVIAIQMGSGLRIPVVGTLLALAVIFGLWVDNHAVGRRAFGVAATGPIDRLSLAQAYEQWRAAQKGGADARKTMILVAVQGGASRAGYWTAVALSSLREAAKAKGVDIDPHIFAISSVSGGSVGAVGYAAMLKSAPDAPDFKLRLMRFAGENVLGGAVTGMLFPDLLQRFLPVTFLPDRAETLERSWEDAWASIDPKAPSAGFMREPFLNLAPKAGEPWRPILIVQGASENSGRRRPGQRIGDRRLHHGGEDKRLELAQAASPSTSTPFSPAQRIVVASPMNSPCSTTPGMALSRDASASGSGIAPKAQSRIKWPPSVMKGAPTFMRSAISPCSPSSRAAASTCSRVARAPKRSISTGSGKAPSVLTRLPASAMTIIRSRRRRDDFFAQQRAAAALYQPQRVVEFIGAVDGEIKIGTIVQRREFESEPRGLGPRRLGGRHARRVMPGRAEQIDEMRGGGAGAEPQPHAGADEGHRGGGRRALELVGRVRGHFAGVVQTTEVSLRTKQIDMKPVRTSTRNTPASPVWREAINAYSPAGPALAPSPAG